MRCTLRRVTYLGWNLTFSDSRQCCCVIRIAIAAGSLGLAAGQHVLHVATDHAIKIRAGQNRVMQKGIG